ncbi:MAG TPA: LPS export ABC transporter periplasmic protein LptC [Flavipsychrobacter sp.]|nr:LPS export ABC transporter periplasmic protein LptC [Flavipsychrobacter sp.]
MALLKYSFVLVLLLLSCGNDTKEIRDLMSKTEMQQDKAYGVTIIYSENAHIKARLFATEFIHNGVAKPPYYDAKKGLRMEFYDDSTQVESTLTARYARYYEEEGNILIRDSIVIVSKKGEQLDTEELVYNQKLKKFYTEKQVRITTPTQVLYGDGLEANEDFSWYEIKNIKGMFAVEKSSVPQ